ncbi:hypothetical protein HY441_01155, partial [Candidatus Microgenomates bacterium]|nr:hypothetical protein [Candidatus Microgenomates bacterium]
MASNLRQDQRGLALVIELVIVAIVIGVLVFVGYRVYQVRKTPSSPETAQPLSETATW